MPTFFKRPIKVNLLVKILAAMALGVAAGQFLPDALVRISATFNSLFSQFLGFLIPLLILGFVAPAIGDIGKGAGKMLAATAGIAYLFTTLSSFFAFGISDQVFPSLITPGTLAAPENAAGSPLPYFTVDMPPLMGVTSALVLAFVLGICMAHINGKFLQGTLNEFREVISMTIGKVIIPLLPFYIFGIFLDMTVAGQVGPVMGSFVKIIVVIFAMHIALLLIQFSIAGVISRRNPLKLLLTMMPAYFTALGTQSSAATIPVTMERVRRAGVTGPTAGFVVPLCATIHLSGSAMKITACVVAMMLMQGISCDFATMAGFICMLGITMVAAPGVPGGAIMAALGIMASMLGFTEADQALMIALYIAMDSFGTACNVTGDGAIAVIVDRLFGRRLSGGTAPGTLRDAA